MNRRSASSTPDWFENRGFSVATPDSLVTSLRSVLETVPTALYGQSSSELTEGEREALRAGGVDLERPLRTDPLESTIALFAAIVSSSLSTSEVAERLAIPPGQVRQMIARRTLYSVKLDERRHVPRFQFRENGPLVTNINRVNPALPDDLHPVSVYDWYTSPNLDLTLGGGDDDELIAVSPLQWLASGGDPKLPAMLAKRL